jgi:hypothetical protein
MVGTVLYLSFKNDFFTVLVVGKLNSEAISLYGIRLS